MYDFAFLVKRFQSIIVYHTTIEELQKNSVKFVGNMIYAQAMSVRFDGY